MKWEGLSSAPFNPPCSLAPVHDYDSWQTKTTHWDARNAIFLELIIIIIGCVVKGPLERCSCFCKWAYLITLTTRHVMSTAVTTTMRITTIFKVGRWVSMDETRDSVVVVEEFIFDWSSVMDVVEIKRGAGEERVCGSPVAPCHATANNTNVRTSLCFVMMMGKINDSCQKCEAFRRLLGEVWHNP